MNDLGVSRHGYRVLHRTHPTAFPHYSVCEFVCAWVRVCLFCWLLPSVPGWIKKSEETTKEKKIGWKKSCGCVPMVKWYFPLQRILQNSWKTHEQSGSGRSKGPPTLSAPVHRIEWALSIHAPPVHCSCRILCLSFAEPFQSAPRSSLTHSFILLDFFLIRALHIICFH